MSEQEYKKSDFDESKYRILQQVEKSFSDDPKSPGVRLTVFSYDGKEPKVKVETFYNTQAKGVIYNRPNIPINGLRTTAKMLIALADKLEEV